LVELVLSMTMLSIVMVGASTLETSVIRMQTGTSRNMEFHNDLSFAYRYLDLDFGTAALVMIDAMPEAEEEEHYYEWRIRPDGASEDGTEDITYILDLESDVSLFTRTEGETTIDLVPPGRLSMGSLARPQGGSFAMWATPDLELITLNIKMNTHTDLDKYGADKSGFAKSIFVRTGNVMDCRDGSC
jgi:hypothetical protein